MSLHIDERRDGGFAFYIDGDLQFDTVDEALYHESLALPALCLAAGPQIRALICGGGDGLALRECLRFPGVTHVDLVDYDPEVVALGRTRFAEQNGHAFDDPRVRVHLQDAWEFLVGVAPYDVVLCDFTVPRRPEDTRIFTVEWYARVRAALAPTGMVALNAVSPEMTPEAFWCLHRTVRTAGLFPLPYRVCLPSFRAHGYGAWGFMLAAPRPLYLSDLRTLECPAPTRQADLKRLWRGSRFSRQERATARRMPNHTLAAPCLLPLMLNPAAASPPAGPTARFTPAEPAAPCMPVKQDTAGALAAPATPALAGRGASAGLHRTQIRGDADPYDLDPLLRAIPITHPYHTRAMVETLAAQVAGAVRTLDMQRLVDALLRRARDLPQGLCRELGRLRNFLAERMPRLETFGLWSRRLFATLVLLITLANSIAPDNAFAKGAAGLGHASMSRGYVGSFGGERGLSSVGRSASGSFGGARGPGGSFGAGRTGGFGTRGIAASSSFRGRALTGTGFRRTYGADHPTDIYGYAYQPRVFRYCGGGAGHTHPYYISSGGPRPAMAPPIAQRALFVADDDMLVLENGDIVLTLSDTAYLLLTGGTLALMSQKSTDPLAPLYPDPALFQAVADRLQEQRWMAEGERGARRDWLSWVGWTGALFSSVRDEEEELRHLDDLIRRLQAAQRQLIIPPENTTPVTLRPGQVELFAGGILTENGAVALRGPDGRMLTTDGRRLWQEGARERPCPPVLAAALRSLLLKLHREMAADLAAQENDLRQQDTDLKALNSDLAEYQQIYQANGYQGDYEVDYGTDSIGVSDAIARTQRDIQETTAARDVAQSERGRTSADLERLTSALDRFAP